MLPRNVQKLLRLAVRGSKARVKEIDDERDRRLDAFEWIDAFRTDLRVAARQLKRAPVFALGAVTALALGVGANATMFSVVDRLLLRAPAQVAAPQDVYTLHVVPRDRVSFPAFVDLRDQLSSVASVAVQSSPWALPIGRGDRARIAQVVFADGGYFRTLGARPAAGRLFSDADSRQPDARAVAVISFRLWQQEFDGDPSVVGRELVVASTHVTIVGVAAHDFNGIETRPVDLWLPVPLANGLMPSLGPKYSWVTTNAHWLDAIVRVAPGVDSRMLAARATTLLRAGDVDRASRDTTARVQLQSILPSRAATFSPIAKIATLLGVVSMLVLLLACSNVTNLMLVRAIRRRREIAVRLALGVSTRRLLAGLLTDAMVLSALGGIAAIVVGAGGCALMRDVLLDGVVWQGPLIDGRMIAFIGASAVATGLCTGIMPSLVLLRRFDLSRAIAEGRQSGGIQRHRIISTLVVTQTALSALLLAGTLLFVRSLENVRSVPLGIDLEHSVIVSLDGRTLRGLQGRADAVFEELRRAFVQVPGVASVDIGEGMPFTQFYMTTPIGVPGRSPNSPAIERGAAIRAVTSSYFATIGTRIVQGRSFTNADDRDTGERVAIVSEEMSRALWPSGDAVGSCVRLGADSVPCRRIIGVAQATQESAVNPLEVDSPYIDVVYVPLSQGRHNVAARTLIVRVKGHAADAVGQIRLAFQRVEPNMPLADVSPLQSRHDRELKPWRLGATMFGAFGALALILTALGLYGVIAYSVEQRRGEMGIRIALGARKRNILSLVGAQGLLLTGIGITIATAAAMALAPLVQPLLFHTSARSIDVYALIGVGLLVVAIAASLIPAARATRVSPISALRAD